MTPLEELNELLAELEQRAKWRLIDTLFPDEGPLRRELYPRHMDFFAAGRQHRERLFIAANRVGKTIAGGCETVYHLTGDYPDWWQGRRFEKGIRALVAGDTAQTTRDILQAKLLGPLSDIGTGLIPHAAIVGTQSRQGVSGAVETITVRHVSGNESQLMLRSYDQGRRIFQGFELELAWLDEEAPYEVYEEALIRTMTTNGMLMLTFTPLNGLTPLVTSFLKMEVAP
jgi:phage terminase large subunit-like protein